MFSKLFLLIAFLLIAVPVMALPPNGENILDDYDNASFVVCIDYDCEKAIGSFGMTAPLFNLPLGKLYAFALGDVGTDVTSLEGKAAYVIPTGVLDFFVGITAGPQSDWASLSPDSPMINYLTGAGGVLVGRAWTNWGLIFHYERIMPIDGDALLKTTNSMKLGIYLDIF